MSLINQMLKDLEKRRADSVASSDSPLKGVNRYSVASQRPPYLIYLLVTGLVLLAALAGFLGWAYLNQSQSQAAAQPPAASQSAPAVATVQPSQTEPARPAEPRPAPRTESRAQAPVAEPEPQQSAPRASQSATAGRAEQPKPVSPPEEAEPTGDSKISKRVRPLSGEQQAELAYKKGYQLLSRGQQEGGEKQLRLALQAFPGHHRARELLTGLYIKAGRYVEAADLLREGVRLAPERPLFAKLYARVLLEQENVSLAIKVLERQPPPTAVDTEYHALLAALYQRAGEYLKAAGRYRDVLRVNPNIGTWWIGLGLSLEHLGKYEEASAAYRRAKSSGNLTKGLMQYTDNRLAAMKESGLPTE